MTWDEVNGAIADLRKADPLDRIAVVRRIDDAVAKRLRELKAGKRFVMHRGRSVIDDGMADEIAAAIHEADSASVDELLTLDRRLQAIIPDGAVMGRLRREHRATS
jgi:hypothetical protein